MIPARGGKRKKNTEGMIDREQEHVKGHKKGMNSIHNVWGL